MYEIVRVQNGKCDQFIPSTPAIIRNGRCDQLNLCILAIIRNGNCDQLNPYIPEKIRNGKCDQHIPLRNKIGMKKITYPGTKKISWYEKDYGLKIPGTKKITGKI
jgi:hypothetical protein